MKVRRSEDEKDRLERYDLVMRGIADGIWDWNIQTKEVFYSERFKELLEYEPDEITNQVDEFQSRVHPLDQAEVMKAFDQHINHQKPYCVECRLQTKSGAYTWFLIRADSQRNSEGRSIRMVGTIQDISTTKKAELQRTDERTLMQIFIEHAPASVAMFDREMRYIAVSTRWLTDYGVERANVIGRCHYEVFPNISDEWKEIHRRCLTGEVQRCECDRWRPPGWVCDQYVCWEIRPWKDVHGSYGGLVMFTQDITNQVETMQALQIAQNKAQESNRLKSEFLANTSHEIRTPMNCIIGMTQLLFDTHLDTDQHSLLSDIEYAAKSLMAIINDILDLSKIESGKLELNPIAFDLNELIERLLKVLKPKADEKGTCVVYEPDDTVPRFLVGDEVRLRQVLMNLVGNAIKFTRDDGGLIITSYGRQQPDNSLILEFSIADTGIGIESSKIETIFEPFTQADGATTRKYGGTGLGLTICRELVELMGGSIWVESIPDIGSVFHFTVRLEIAVDQSAAADPTNVRILQSKVHSGSIKPRLLVVEDNPVNQKLFSRILEYMGCDVVLAGDGKAALDKVTGDTQGFSLIFMDCQMPVMNGYDATREIRRLEKYTGEHAIIVAMTANAMDGDDRLCLEAGMDDYLTKPIDRAQLRNLLARYTSSPLNQ